MSNTLFDLSGKTAVITGSSRGIGFELVKLFNKNNFNVIALSRNYSVIDDLQLKNVKSFYLDISSTKDVKFPNVSLAR